MSNTPVAEISREKASGTPGWGSTAAANPAPGLHVAAATGDRAAVLLQLALGAEPGTLSAEGWAPLHIAAVRGDWRIVDLLLRAAAPTDQRGGSGGRGSAVGLTPLHCAAAGGHVDVVEALIARGASVDAPDRAGFTPLHTAAASGRIGVVRALLKARADVLARVGGATALDLARRGRHHDTAALLRQVEGMRRPARPVLRIR